MKNLTQKYILLQEGAYSEHNFLRDARRTHPDLVSNHNTFKDAVKILSRKGIIQEVEHKEKTVEENPVNEDTYTISDILSMANKAKEVVIDAGYALEDLATYYGDAIPHEKVIEVLHNYDLDIEDVVYDAPEDEPQYGTHPTDGAPDDTEMPSWMTEAEKTIDRFVKQMPNLKKVILESKKEQEGKDQFPPHTLDKAVRYELEKIGIDVRVASPSLQDFTKARKKAITALTKNPHYYLDLPTSKKKRTDVMQDVKKDNHVDKDNEMKKAPLHEIKKVIKRAVVKTLQENNKDSDTSKTLEITEKELERLKKGEVVKLKAGGTMRLVNLPKSK